MKGDGFPDFMLPVNRTKVMVSIAAAIAVISSLLFVEARGLTPTSKEMFLEEYAMEDGDAKHVGSMRQGHENRSGGRRGRATASEPTGSQTSVSEDRQLSRSSIGRRGELAAALTGHSAQEPKEGAPDDGARAGGGCGSRCPGGTLPRQGVFEWLQCGRTSGQCTGDDSEPQGSENIGGITRSFPRTGFRRIRISAADSWVVEHLYAEEHRETFHLSGDETGSYGHRYKVDITVLGYTRTIDIRESPPAQAVRFPLVEGDSWSGHWKDSNGNADGNYTCTVLGRDTIVVGGRRIKTWVVRMNARLLGPQITGNFEMTLWVAPRLGTTVQEAYDQSLKVDGRFSYSGRWMTTLKDLRPIR